MLDRTSGDGVKIPGRETVMISVGLGRVRMTGLASTAGVFWLWARCGHAGRPWSWSKRWWARCGEMVTRYARKRPAVTVLTARHLPVRPLARWSIGGIILDFLS